ncbi:MAG TPA: hypothetical protein PK435_10575 [Thermoanaerobaculaceae bacterium]|nr:hypothetical protein [Thermoanaerobaculaceae bacterium]
MEVPSGLFEASKGKEVEVVVTGRQAPIAGILESVGANSLELRDGPDDVWVNLSAVVSIRVHARQPPVKGVDSKRSVTSEPGTREVVLFCKECGYERMGREPIAAAEKPEAAPGAVQAIDTCPACGCTSWTRTRPQP